MQGLPTTTPIVQSILGPCPFWVQFGSVSISCPFCVHFVSILGPFRVHFGSISCPFWVHFGSVSVSCRAEGGLQKTGLFHTSSCFLTSVQNPLTTNDAFVTMEDPVAYITQTRSLGMKPGLESVRALLQQLGNPQVCTRSRGFRKGQRFASLFHLRASPGPLLAVSFQLLVSRQSLVVSRQPPAVGGRLAAAVCHMYACICMMRRHGCCASSTLRFWDGVAQPHPAQPYPALPCPTPSHMHSTTARLRCK